MTLPPWLAPIDPHISNGDSFGHALAVDGDRQPLFALCGLDLVPVTPAMFVVLHIVIKNEQIRFADLSKVPPPRDVRWLQNDDVHSPTVS